MKRNRSIVVVLLFGVWPSVAQANMGTPLMLAGVLHLWLGNLIIGVLEGVLLAKVFKLSTGKCISLLVLANYLSAWLGGLVIAPAIAGVLPMGLYSAWPLFWLMVLIAYLLTLLLEYPFVAAAFRGDTQWRRKSIRGSLLIQTVSYVILIGWYWLPSHASLYTQTDVTEISSIFLPEKVLVYFISANDGDVYAGSLRDQQWQNTFDLNSSRRRDHLFVRPSVKDADSWDLVARLGRDDHGKPDLVTVAEQFASVVAPSWESVKGDPRYEGAGLNYGTVPKLGDAQSSSWEFSSGFSPYEGFHGMETYSGREVSFFLEIPFLDWQVSNVTHLPTDKVLLQLGDDQICVYDPVENRIARLAWGRGPVAVTESNEPNEAIAGDRRDGLQ